jgi:hypothetical protein
LRGGVEGGRGRAGSERWALGHDALGRTLRGPGDSIFGDPPSQLRGSARPGVHHAHHESVYCYAQRHAWPAPAWHNRPTNQPTARPPSLVGHRSLASAEQLRKGGAPAPSPRPLAPAPPGRASRPRLSCPHNKLLAWAGQHASSAAASSSHPTHSCRHPDNCSTPHRTPLPTARPSPWPLITRRPEVRPCSS